MAGSWPAIVMVSGATMIAVVLLSASVEGWFGRNLSMPVRAMLAVATLCLAWPDWRARLAGLAIAAAAILPGMFNRERPVPAVAGSRSE